MVDIKMQRRSVFPGSIFVLFFALGLAGFVYQWYTDEPEEAGVVQMDPNAQDSHSIRDYHSFVL